MRWRDSDQDARCCTSRFRSNGHQERRRFGHGGDKIQAFNWDLRPGILPGAKKKLNADVSGILTRPRDRRARKIGRDIGANLPFG
jgi:hypothetical protein